VNFGSAEGAKRPYISKSISPVVPFFSRQACSGGIQAEEKTTIANAHVFTGPVWRDPNMAPSTYPPFEYFNVTFPAPYVAHVEINRPKKLNSFFGKMWPEMKAIFERVSTDPEVRCVLFSGAGDRAFTSGMACVPGLTVAWWMDAKLSMQAWMWTMRLNRGTRYHRRTLLTPPGELPIYADTSSSYKIACRVWRVAGNR